MELADKALAAHLKLVDEGKELNGTGTGKVVLLVFDLDP
jgi:hypothetical protein